MENLSEHIGRITNLLEDAVEDQSWEIVQKMIEELDDLYHLLERQESSFDTDFL